MGILCCTEYYGNTGLVTVDTDMTPFFTTAWAAAGVELGYTVADPNGRQRESEFNIVMEDA